MLACVVMLSLLLLLLLIYTSFDSLCVHVSACVRAYACIAIVVEYLRTVRNVQNNNNEQKKIENENKM